MKNVMLQHVPIKLEAISEDAEEDPNGPKRQQHRRLKQNKQQDDPDTMSGLEEEEDVAEEEDDEDDGDSDQDSDESDESEPLALEEDVTVQISSDEEAELEKQRIDFRELLAKRLSLDNASVASLSGSGRTSLNTSRSVSPNDSRNSSRSNSIVSGSHNIPSRGLSNRLRSRRCSTASTSSSIKVTKDKKPVGNKLKGKIRKPQQIQDEEEKEEDAKHDIRNGKEIPDAIKAATKTTNSKEKENEKAKMLQKEQEVAKFRRRNVSGRSESVSSSSSSYSSGAEGCGCILIYDKKNDLIFSCGMCDLRYEALETFAKHICFNHKVMDEEHFENDSPNSKREEMFGGKSSPPITVDQELVGNVFSLQRRKLFVKCAYCECRYANLDLFKKHLKQHKLLAESELEPDRLSTVMSNIQVPSVTPASIITVGLPNLVPSNEVTAQQLPIIALKKEIKTEIVSNAEGVRSREISPLSTTSSTSGDHPMVIIPQEIALAHQNLVDSSLTIASASETQKITSQSLNKCLENSVNSNLDSDEVPSVLDSPQSPSNLDEFANKESQHSLSIIQLEDRPKLQDQIASIQDRQGHSLHQPNEFLNEEEEENLNQHLESNVKREKELTPQHETEINDEQCTIPMTELQDKINNIPDRTDQPFSNSEDTLAFPQSTNEQVFSTQQATEIENLPKESEGISSLQHTLVQMSSTSSSVSEAFVANTIVKRGRGRPKKDKLPITSNQPPKKRQRQEKLIQKNLPKISKELFDSRRSSGKTDGTPRMKRPQKSVSDFFEKIPQRVSQRSQELPSTQIEESSQNQKDIQLIPETPCESLVVVQEKEKNSNKEVANDQQEKNKENLNQNVIENLRSNSHEADKRPEVLREVSSIICDEDEEVALISREFNAFEASASKEENFTPETLQQSPSTLSTAQTTPTSSPTTSIYESFFAKTPTSGDQDLNDSTAAKKLRGRKCLKQDFTCQFCTKVFNKQSRFVEHVRLHTGEKPFQCDVCKREFRLKMRLNEHLLRHREEKAFKCDMCGLALATKQDLTQHLRHHKGDRRFKCAQCPKAFVRGSDLKIHERVHTGEKPFACEICSKRFRANQNLIVHRRSHTLEKNFACDICDKRFMRKVDRKVHMRTHTGERPFKCHICNRGYSSSAHVKAHLQREHDESGVCVKKERKKGAKGRQAREGSAKDFNELEISDDEVTLKNKQRSQKRKEKKPGSAQKEELNEEAEDEIDDNTNDFIIKTPKGPKKKKKRIHSEPIEDYVASSTKQVEELLNALESPETMKTSNKETEQLRKLRLYNKCFTMERRSTIPTKRASLENVTDSSNGSLNLNSLPPSPATNAAASQQLSVTVSMQVEKVPAPNSNGRGDIAADDDDILEAMPEKENDTTILKVGSSVSSSPNNLPPFKEVGKKERNKVTSYFTVVGQKSDI